jgi:hypothetical protein
LELEEQKRASDAAKQEHEDTTNVLADIIKKKSQELSSMTKKLRSMQERVVQFHWKEQSSRLVAARKAQLQVRSFITWYFRPFLFRLILLLLRRTNRLMTRRTNFCHRRFLAEPATARSYRVTE